MQRCHAALVLTLIASAGCRSKPAAHAVVSKATLLWSAETGAAPAVGSRPAVAPDGTVYVGGTIETRTGETTWTDAYAARQPALLAFDPDGKMKTKVVGKTDDSLYAKVPKVSIAIAPWGSVFAMDDSGGLYGVVVTGETFYHQTGNRLLSSPPAIGSGGLLYVGGVGGLRGYAIETTGDPLAFFLNLGNGSAYPPVTSPDGRVYFFREARPRGLVALDSGGNELWTNPTGAHGPLAVDAEGNVLGVDESTVLSYLSDGRIAWSFKGSEPLLAPPVAGPGHLVYVVSRMGLLRAIENGSERWSLALAQLPKTAPITGADGTIYVLGTQGTVFAVDPSGRQRFRIPIGRDDGEGFAVSADGRIYVVAGDRRLYAFAPPGS